MSSAIMSMLPLALLILIVWGVARLLKRSAAKKTVESGISDTSAGVGGWLLFLICGLIFLGPLMGAGRINSELITAESTYPQLVTLESWVTFKSATWWSFLIVCCISVYCGYSLLKRRDPRVVRQAKILLWVIGPLSNLVMGIIVPLAVFGKMESDPQIFGAIIASAVMATIWTIYLSKSKRVNATYVIRQA